MAPKVLVTRLLPDKAQDMLYEAERSGQIELVARKEDSAAERSWLMQQLKDGSINGILCMLGDKVLLGHCLLVVACSC